MEEQEEKDNMSLNAPFFQQVAEKIEEASISLISLKNKIAYGYELGVPNNENIILCESLKTMIHLCSAFSDFSGVCLASQFSGVGKITSFEIIAKMTGNGLFSVDSLSFQNQNDLRSVVNMTYSRVYYNLNNSLIRPPRVHFGC